jgi:hydrogenase maturation protease
MAMAFDLFSQPTHDDFATYSRAPEFSDTVIIGCGNLLRGDDGVGPILIRQLWNEGLGSLVTLVDGGTAGMDVAFKMADANLVVIVDAAVTGSSPGTIFRVPGEELENLPPLSGFVSHAFRWDHALAFSRWLLGDSYPKRIEVFLIEVSDVSLGAELSLEVAKSMNELADILRKMVQEMVQDRLQEL